jgi:hypothetical protein
VDIDMADNISSTRAMLESAVLELSTLERQAEHTKSVFEASIDITSHYGHSFLTTDEIMNNNNYTEISFLDNTRPLIFS